MSAGPAGRVAVRLLVLLVVVLAGLLVAGPAQAHVAGGAAGSDYDGRVRSVTPALPGVSVRSLQFGDQLQVVNDTDRELAVPGYSGEPYLRIGPDGVWRNRLSPAAYLNLDLRGRTPLPPDADPTAAPQWVQISTAQAYVWHDHRTHWMSSGLPPQVRADPTVAHTVIDWTVPMTYDGRPVSVAGRLTWSPPPPGWLVWPGYALVVVAAVLAGLVARTARPLGALLLVGGLAAVVHAATTPEPAVTLSSWSGALVSALLPGVLVLAVGALGWRAAVRGRGAMVGLLALVVGWLLLVVGIPDLDALWSAHVAGSGPTLLTRAAVTLELGLGAGLLIGGVAALRRFREPVGTDHRRLAEPAPG